MAETQRLDHADPRTTRLYDRRDKKITRNDRRAHLDLNGASTKPLLRGQPGRKPIVQMASGVLLSLMSTLIPLLLVFATVAGAQNQPTLRDIRSSRVSVCVPNDEDNFLARFMVLRKDSPLGATTDRASALAEMLERSFRDYISETPVHIISVRSEADQVRCLANLEGEVFIERKTLNPLTYRIEVFLAITNKAKYSFEAERLSKTTIWETKLERVFYYPWRAATISKYGTLLADQLVGRKILRGPPVLP